MSLLRKNNVKSGSYSTTWNILGKLKTAAIFALLLLESPIRVIAQEANNNNELARGSVVSEELSILPSQCEMLAVAANNAFYYDDVESYINYFGNSVPDNMKDPTNYLFYKFPQLNLEIKPDFFGQMCINGNKNIAKYLLDNHHYDAELFPRAIAASAYEGQKELLKHLTLTTEQVTLAFAWLNDVININRLDMTESKTQYTKAVKLLVELGANLNTAKKDIFMFPRVANNLDLVRYYLKHGADMYKITESKYIPLETGYDPIDSYANMVIEFCKHGYDIYHAEPQYGKDLANMQLDILDPDTFNQFLEIIKRSPHTKKLFEEILKNQSARSANVYYNIFYAISIVSIFVLIEKSYIYFKEQKSRQEKIKKLKMQLEKEQAEKEEFKNIKGDAVVKRKISVSAAAENVPEIRYSSIAAESPKVKTIKSPHVKTAHQLRAEEIALAKEASHKAKELMIAQQKQAAILAKEQAEIHKAEWKKKQETDKQERLEREMANKTKFVLHKHEEITSPTSSPSHIRKNSLTSEYTRSAVEHAANIVVISSLKESKSSDYYELNSFINHLALIYNIHKYNLSMLSYMIANPRYKNTNELIFAKQMRNLMVHGNASQENFTVVLETAKQMKEIMPQDLDRLIGIHTSTKVVDEKDIKELMELAGIGKLQTIFLTSMEETPLYQSLAKKAEEQINNNFAGADNLRDEDNAYYKWVIKKMFPLMNRIASPIMKSATKSNIREYFGISLDAIKMLLAMCGEHYNTDRKRRMHVAKLRNNLHPILFSCNELRNKVTHENHEVADKYVIDLCREIAKFNSVKCELNNLDISIQSAASSSSVSATTAGLFHIKKTLAQEDARVARIERCVNPG
ncbi:MAG: hypothetical protein P4M12_10390 [Gammaproteobacteria bacterium]|nr:hypothetical protein [Gammaproteobacteria bacterium]